MTFKTFHLSSVPFRNQRLIVAVSGGLDSMALLHLLMELSKEGGFGLIAAHVNYGLRGKDSRLDEEHVRHFCREHKVPFRCLRLNASKKDFRVIHKSLQEWAREKRYGYFKRLAIREKAWGVAVAHHMEDQAETILDRILRGAGGKGLSGMRSFQELRFDPKLPPLKIWRPLLHFSKPDLEKYLDSQGVGWRQDKSNLKDVYRRNQIRSQVIPFLKKWNPSIVQTLSKIADITAEEDDLLETLTKDWESSSKPRVGKAEYGIDLKKVRGLPRALQRRWVRHAMQALEPNARGIPFERVEEALDVWRGMLPGPRDIGHGLSAEVITRQAVLKKKNLPMRVRKKAR